MAYSLRQSAIGDNAGSPCTITLGTPALAGSLLVVAAVMRGAAVTSFTITDNIGGAWSYHPLGTIHPGGINGQGIAYKVAQGGETTLTTYWGGANDRNRAAASEWIGYQVHQVNANAQAAGTSPTYGCGSVTPTRSNLLIIGSNATSNFDGDFTIVATGGETDGEIDNHACNLGFHPHLWNPYKIVGGPSGSYALTGSIGSGVDWKGLILAFNGLASGGIVGEPGGGVW